MKYIVKLKKKDNTEVTAIVDARTEGEAGGKASKTANLIAKNNNSRILMTDAPLVPTGVEVWETKSTKVMKGDKVYGVLVATATGNIEDIVRGVAGEKSAYSLVMKQLNFKGEIRVFLFDLNQKPEKVAPKKPEVDSNGNIELTIAEAIDEKRVSFKEFYEVLQQMGLAESDFINSTDIIEQYIEEQEEADIEVSHMREALEEGSSTDLWYIWLGNSMETPEPIENKKDLVDYLELEDMDLKKVLEFNIRNR